MSLLHWGRAVVLAGLLLAAAACAPAPEIPTLMVLPSLTFTPVATVTSPPTLPPTSPPALLPTATPVPAVTSTPAPTEPPTPTVVPVADILLEAEALVQGLHANCVPQTVGVRVILAGPVGEDTQVLLKWDYEGRPSSRPGTPLERLSPNEFSGTLGPFERALPVLVRAIVSRGRAESLSGEYRLVVAVCDAPTPAPTSPYGIMLTATPTPTYGADLSVQAASLTLGTDRDTPLQVALTWTGGVPPYTLDRVSRPRYGTLDGTGPVRVYIPNPNFSGIDRFTFVVTDGNAQASMGTVTIYVGIEPPTAEP